jgi:acyl-CoA thioester hydrolase
MRLAKLWVWYDLSGKFRQERNAMITVHKGVAHLWQCDILGHLTTRFYVAMFDDASYHLLHAMFGWSGNADDEGRLSCADVRHTIDYKAEVLPGDLLEVRAALTRIGGKSLTVAYEMIKLGNGEVAATLECVMVLFDRQERKSVTIPDDLRAKAESFLEKRADSS